MSTFETPTNVKRVEKMIETLNLLAKSAKSNKASKQEFSELLQPLLQRLRPFFGEAATAPATTMPHKTTTEPEWFRIREAAEKADLRDLSYAMAVYINRIGEHLDETLKDT